MADKTLVAEYESSSSGKIYRVMRDPAGNLFCDCPAWRFKKTGQDRTCKHTQMAGEAAPAKRAALAEAKPKHGRYEPMLAEPGSVDDASGSGGAFLYEVKHDGVRALAYVTDGKVRLYGRRGAEYTAGFPELAALGSLPRAAVLDGEILCLDEQGQPDFARIQGRVHRQDALAVHLGVEKMPATFMAFDLLELNGVNLTATGQAVPLEQRKELLLRLLEASGPRKVDCIGYVEDQADGTVLFAEQMALGREGIMAKRRRGLYHPGKRSADWVKIKGVTEDSFIACGLTTGTGWRKPFFGSVLLGKPNSATGAIRYVGSVGTGFDNAALEGFLARTAKLRSIRCPFLAKPNEPELICYLEPLLVVDVKYQSLTPDGKLRFPVFMRVREELTAKEVRPSPLEAVSSYEP